MSSTSTNRVLAIGAGVLGALALIGGDTPAPGGSGEMSALELAAALRDDPGSMLVLDVRDVEAYEEFHAPRARRVEPSTSGSLPAGLHLEREGPIVVTGGPAADPRPLWLALKRAGHPDVYYVPDIVSAWLDDIISPVLSPTAGPEARAAWEEQAELSRYFGGFPRIAEESPGEDTSSTARLRRAKRRGCAF